MTGEKDYSIAQVQGELEDMIRGWVEANSQAIIADSNGASRSEMHHDEKKGYVVLALNSGQTVHVDLTMYP